jgi:cardiolipin synthase
MSFLRKVLLGFVAVLVIMMAWIGWLSVTRGTPVRRVLALGDRSGPPPVTDSLFSQTMELFAGTHLEPANRVQLLANGEQTYPPLWRDVAAARQSITVQMYYSQPGAVADTMRKYLVDRARSGVRVLLLFDAFGSQNLTSKDWLAPLKAAGVRVAMLRPLHWYGLNKANFRSHVRVVIVDGHVGYTGGFGLADYWLGDGHHEDQWREMNVRFEGPAVMQLQAAFAAGWAEATGELLTGEMFFPRASFRAHDVGVPAGLLYAMPTTGSTNGERFMALSIASARKSLYITNSYFVPDDDFRRLLVRARRQGVDVRIITAGPKTDVKTTTYAGRARYEQLLGEGIRIYEYQPTMMHSKTFVVDGLWSTVGSLNFDNRSLAFNNESNLVVLDTAIGASMDSLFMDDIKWSKEITLPEFQRRGRKERILEWGANLLSRML